MMFTEFWKESWSAAIVNHLWQSTLMMLVAWLLTLVLKRNQARTRYWIWMAASLKFLAPFSLLAAIGNWLRPASVLAIESPQLTSAMMKMADPFLPTESRVFHKSFCRASGRCPTSAPRQSASGDFCGSMAVRIVIPASALDARLVGNSRYAAVGFSGVPADRCTSFLNVEHDRTRNRRHSPSGASAARKDSGSTSGSPALQYSGP
jgi:hypothetical protein